MVAQKEKTDKQLAVCIYN